MTGRAPGHQQLLPRGSGVYLFSNALIEEQYPVKVPKSAASRTVVPGACSVQTPGAIATANCCPSKAVLIGDGSSDTRCLLGNPRG